MANSFHFLHTFKSHNIYHMLRYRQRKGVCQKRVVWNTMIVYGSQGTSQSKSYYVYISFISVSLETSIGSFKVIDCIVKHHSMFWSSACKGFKSNIYASSLSSVLTCYMITKYPQQMFLKCFKRPESYHSVATEPIHQVICHNISSADIKRTLCFRYIASKFQQQIMHWDDSHR